jgi:hypothetical protein
MANRRLAQYWQQGNPEVTSQKTSVSFPSTFANPAKWRIRTGGNEHLRSSSRILRKNCLPIGPDPGNKKIAEIKERGEESACLQIGKHRDKS